MFHFQWNQLKHEQQYFYNSYIVCHVLLHIKECCLNLGTPDGLWPFSGSLTRQEMFYAVLYYISKAWYNWDATQRVVQIMCVWSGFFNFYPKKIIWSPCFTLNTLKHFVMSPGFCHYSHRDSPLFVLLLFLYYYKFFATCEISFAHCLKCYICLTVNLCVSCFALYFS